MLNTGWDTGSTYVSSSTIKLIWTYESCILTSSELPKCWVRKHFSNKSWESNCESCFLTYSQTSIDRDYRHGIEGEVECQYWHGQKLYTLLASVKITPSTNKIDRSEGVARCILLVVVWSFCTLPPLLTCRASCSLFSQLPACHPSIRTGFAAARGVWKVLIAVWKNSLMEHTHELSCFTSRQFHKIGANGRI